MIAYRILVFVALIQWTNACTAAEPYLTIEGKEGLGKGQYIVFVTGEEYYRSEEGMSMFAKILSQHHGFKCSVVRGNDAYQAANRYTTGSSSYVLSTEVPAMWFF